VMSVFTVSRYSPRTFQCHLDAPQYNGVN